MFIMAHPLMSVYLALSFFLTFLFYVFPSFVSEHLVIQGNLTPGTFLGTMVHKNWEHFLGNFLILIPLWVYADKVLGTGITGLLVLMNMLITGFFVLWSGGCCCGASGVNHMLLGIMAIMGNWFLLFFAGVMFLCEIKIQGENDQTAHGVHIIWQIVGTVIALLFCVIRGIIKGVR